MEQNKQIARKSPEKYLCFSLGQEEYALPLLQVKEVIEIPEVSPVPRTPHYYRGIMNLRGLVISIIDLQLKLLKKEITVSPKTAVIILDFQEFYLGIMVNSINRVIDLDDTDIQARPKMESIDSLDYIKGVSQCEKSMILILDVYKALSIDDIEVMQSQNMNKSVA
ncbi:MAG: chemotaxis protein CheW [Oligoflexus sp.]